MGEWVDELDARARVKMDSHIHRLQREFSIYALAEGAQLEVVGGVKGGGDRHVIVDQPEELLLQEVDLLEREHRTED